MRISIGGSIGSGKSTVLKKLQECGYDVFFEPIEEWEHLAEFYRDKSRWAFTFQVEVLHSFTKCCDSDKIIICERSPWESDKIFSKTLVEDGSMSMNEYNLFKKIYEQLAWKPDIFIYLKTTPDICMKRIMERNRNCESTISMEYLEHLHNTYENIYPRNSIVVDASQPADVVFSKIKELLDLLSSRGT